METYTHLSPYIAQFFLEWEILHTKAVEKIKTHISCSTFFSPGSRATYEIMWLNDVQPDMSTDGNRLWRTHFASWVPKATDTHSEYVILFAFHSNNGFANAAQCYAYMYIACLGPSEVRPKCWVFSSGLHQVGSNWWRQPRLRVRWKVAESIIRLSFVLVEQHKKLVLQPTYQLWRAMGGILAKQVDACNKGKYKRERKINEWNTRQRKWR